MGAYEDRANLIWSLSGSGLGTNISGAGNSGNWAIPGPNADYFTPVPLGAFTDLGLLVHVSSITTTPTLVVTVDVYDDAGNLYAAVMTSGNITAAGTKSVYAGLRGGTASAYVVLPNWGRVSWTCSGGTANGVEISLFGR